MRYRGKTRKQERYAWNLMNTELSRGEAMRQAGYTPASSQHPGRIEQSEGFKLAMAGIFAKTGNVSMAMLHEMQAKIDAGELKKQDMKTLVGFFNVMTKAMERIAPKNKEQDANVIKAFSNIIDITPLQNKDETTETIDKQDEVLDNKE